jgi:hypothetical protein
MPKLDDKTLTVLSAVMGGSNLGMGMPDKRTVHRLLACDTVTMDMCVMAMWSGCMEADDHYDMFMKECEWWYRSRSNFNKGRSKSADPAYVRKVWPDIADFMGFNQEENKNG